MSASLRGVLSRSVERLSRSPTLADPAPLSYHKLDDPGREIRDFVRPRFARQRRPPRVEPLASSSSARLHRVFDSPLDAILWDPPGISLRAQDLDRRQSRLRHLRRPTGCRGTRAANRAMHDSSRPSRTRIIRRVRASRVARDAHVGARTSRSSRRSSRRFRSRRHGHRL